MAPCRPVLALVVVVVAGCSGVVVPADRTPTLTPVAVPTDVATESPPATLAPGLTEAGVRDPAALARAHGDVLEDSTFTYRSTYSERAADGTLRSRTVTTVRFGEEGRYHYRRTDRDSEGVVRRDARWSDGEMVWERRTSPGDGRVEEAVGVTGSGDPPIDRSGRVGIERVFRAVETSVTDHEIRNGTTYLRLAGAGLHTPNPSALEDASLEAVVDDRGLVHRYRLEYTVDRGDPDGPARVVAVVWFSAVGTTSADPPTWVDRDETT